MIRAYLMTNIQLLSMQNDHCILHFYRELYILVNFYGNGP